MNGGTPVQIRPISASQVQVVIGDRTVVVSTAELLDSYRRGVDEDYRARVAAAEQAAADARKFVFEESIKNELAIEKSRWDKMSEADRDLIIAEGKRRLELQYGRPVDVAAVTVQDDTGRSIVVFYDKNSGSVTGSFESMPDPTGGGGTMPTFRPVVGAR
jgi:hypothetical protein